MAWSLTAATAPQAVVPVATNMAGSVTVQTSDGARHEVLASKLLHSGDIVSTGPNSLAAVEVADVGKVILGPASTARTQTTGSALSLQLSSGLLCVQSETPTASVNAGALKVAATGAPTVFNLLRNADGTTIAVYRGTVGLVMNGSTAGMLRAGEAETSSHDGTLRQTSLGSVTADFAALHCPDDAVVKEALSVAVAASSPAAAGASGGHGGLGALGWLLGLAAIAAAAGGHGGGGGAAVSQPTPISNTSPGPTPTPIPTATPTPGPTPTPTPSSSPTSPPTISVDPTSLLFSGGGSDSQTFDAHDPLSRNYSASSTNPDVASVSLDRGHDHRATFRVSPGHDGTATILVTDDAGGTGSVSVSVGGGGLVSQQRHGGSLLPVLGPARVVGTPAASHSSLSVGAASLVCGVNHPQFLSVSEAGYAGAFRARSSNDAVATIDPPSGFGPARVFTVTPHAPGIAMLVISDEHGATQIVRVAVMRGRSGNL